TYRPATGTIPTRPGVYRFRDEHGRVIYVGKAKNLRQRLVNYFQDLSVLHERTRRMVTTAASRSEEHTSELQSRFDLVCRLLLVPAPSAATLFPYTTLCRPRPTAPPPAPSPPGPGSTGSGTSTAASSTWARRRTSASAW